MPTDGYNWFLIIVAIVCTVVVTMINVYILVHFQHPEDRNQAWFPKLLVVRAREEAFSLAVGDALPSTRPKFFLPFRSRLPNNGRLPDTARLLFSLFLRCSG